MLRIRLQRLIPTPSGETSSTAQILHDICGVQAQEPNAAHLSIRPRSCGLVAADIENARLGDRSIVRSWIQRGTLHLVTTDDFRWLLPLLGPSMLTASLRRLAQMGFDGSMVAKSIGLIQEILGDHGPLTRSEICGELYRRGGLLAEGQVCIHLIYQAAMHGILCIGPNRRTEPTYVLITEWIGSLNPLPRDQALAMLATRYLTAYGPSTPQDLAAWSGLSLQEARQGWNQIASRLTEVETDQQQLWMLTGQTHWLDEPALTSPVIRLLPRFDTYLLGYSNRELIIAAEFARYLNRGGGIIHPALLIDGRVQGLWETQRRKQRLDITVQPFEKLDPSYLAEIRQEVSDLGRFLGIEASLAGDV